jgi:type I restriction enzyme, R subunit
VQTDSPPSKACTAPASQKTPAIVNGAQHILQLPPDARERSEDRKKRYLESSTALKRAFALSVPHEEAIAIRDEVGYMLAVAGLLNKVGTSTGGSAHYDVDTAISQLISRAVVPQGVIDVFAEAGIDRPDISLLSEEFLEEVRHMPQRNLAAEALQRLLSDQTRVRMTRNAVQARKFSEMLEASIRRY